MVNEINAFLTEACNQFDLSQMKVNAVMEAAVRELMINYEEAQLKVLKESGTDDDLAYLYEEADNGLLETVIKAIQKIKDAVIKFFSEMKDKILDAINKKENKETIDKLEKKAKLLPLIGRKKVIVEDYSKQEKVVDEHLSMLTKLKSKFKAGQKVEASDVDEIEKSFKDKYGKAIGVGAAVSVTVIAAIGIYKALSSKAASRTKMLETHAIDTCDSIMDSVKKGVGNVSVGEKIANAVSSITKRAQEGFFKSMMSTLSKIKDAIRGVKNTAVDSGVATLALKESSEDEMAKEMENTGTDFGNDMDDAVANEDSDDDDPIDTYNQEDPFEKVALGLLGDLNEDELNSLDEPSEDESDGVQEGANDNADDEDTFESYYDKFMAELDSDDIVCESTEEEPKKSVEDLFSSIYESVMNRDVEDDEPVEESVSKADELRARIEALR